MAFLLPFFFLLILICFSCFLVLNSTQYGPYIIHAVMPSSFIWLNTEHFYDMVSGFYLVGRCITRGTMCI